MIAAAVTSTAGADNVSACPSLTRMTQARDGGLCRIRLPAGILTGDQARVIANAAERFGNGVIEASNRSNLQLRGVDDVDTNALIDRLLGAGLGPTIWGADDLRNVMCSPTAGIDAFALHDTRPLVRELLDRLQAEFVNVRSATGAPLSPKFAVQIDGGEALFMQGHHHDVWFAAQNGEGLFAFGLAGCVPVGKKDDAETGTDVLGQLPAARIADFLAALIHTFLSLTLPGESRMRHVIARLGAAEVLRQTAGRMDGTHISSITTAFGAPFKQHGVTGPAPGAGWRRSVPSNHRRFGAHAQQGRDLQHAAFHVGARVPLGRLDAEMLRGLATLAEDEGKGVMHWTPWQGVLLPDISEAGSSRALQRMAALGLICRADLPLGALLACAGSPGCAKGHADVKRIAQQLADRLPQASEVHISGCDRGCAAGHRARYTLNAEAGNTFSVYAAHPRDDSPVLATSHSRFGPCVARGVLLDDALAQLLRLTSTDSFDPLHV